MSNPEAPMHIFLLLGLQASRNTSLIAFHFFTGMFQLKCDWMDYKVGLWAHLFLTTIVTKPYLDILL